MPLWDGQKDGSSKGIRDHEPKGVICMYFPTETTVAMGATALVPGSQFLSVDREGFPTSEDRLELPATIEFEPRTGPDSLPHWSKATARSTAGSARVEDDEEREAALAECIGHIGLPPSSQLRVVCPAGSFLIMHREAFHRGARQHPGAR